MVLCSSVNLAIFLGCLKCNLCHSSGPASPVCSFSRLLSWVPDRCISVFWTSWVWTGFWHLFCLGFLGILWGAAPLAITHVWKLGPVRQVHGLSSDSWVFCLILVQFLPEHQSKECSWGALEPSWGIQCWYKQMVVSEPCYSSFSTTHKIQYRQKYNKPGICFPAMISFLV